MSASDLLLQEIESLLSDAHLSLFFTKAGAAYLFEAYLFTLIIRAARSEGATVAFKDMDGNLARKLIFRTSPGSIYSAVQRYSHAELSFRGRTTLEVHLGIKVSGKSGVQHECDVAVLDSAEAEACRRNQAAPRASQLVLSVECKFYSTPLPLGVARGFIGLTVDLGGKDNFLVTNTKCTAVEKLLIKHRRSWEHQIFPGSTAVIERLHNQFRVVFRDYSHS